jgi:hypothetical protein
LPPQPSKLVMRYVDAGRQAQPHDFPAHARRPSIEQVEADGYQLLGAGDFSGGAAYFHS